MIPKHPRRSASTFLHRAHVLFLSFAALAVDILACPDCGGRLRLLATIEDRAVVERILTHLGLPVDLPRPSAARTPEWLPGVREAADHQDDTGGQWAD